MIQNLPGKIGWPWTKEELDFPRTMSDGKTWPKISIITPSYNQGQFIEETIRSVLLQGYPNLEYIIMDGGSTDETVEIIRKYEKYLYYWESKPDRGQCHAINKGWELMNGTITSWLNSDDLLRPGALRTVAESFERSQDKHLLIGSCQIVNVDRETITIKHPLPLEAESLLLWGSVPGQPSVFLKTSLVNDVGKMNETLHYVLDWEYWLRVSLQFPEIDILEEQSILSEARHWKGNKTNIGLSEQNDSSVFINSSERRRIIKSLDLNEYSFDEASAKALKRRSYSRTYLKQAKYEYQSGRKIRSCGNVIRSLYYYPRGLIHYPLYMWRTLTTN